MLTNSEEQPLIYCFPGTPQRVGRREKPHYKEHRASIGKKYGKRRMPRNCLSQSSWLLLLEKKAQLSLGPLAHNGMQMCLVAPLIFFYVSEMKFKKSSQVLVSSLCFFRMLLVSSCHDKGSDLFRS